jgi:hypothetical protein
MNCEYTYLPEYNVHKYTFLTSSRQTIDEWITLLDELYEKKRGTGEDLLMLIEINEVNIPIRYTTNSVRRWTQKRPDRAKSFVAVTHKANMMMNMLRQIINNMPMVETMRFFLKEKEAEAIEWLQNVEDEESSETDS